MMKRTWIVLVMLMVVPALLFTVSCSKQAVAPAETASETDADLEKQQELERQKQLEEERLAAERAEQLKAEAMERELMMAQNRFLNENVYFEFDSAALDYMAQELLKQKGQWLTDNPDVNVVIEGHTDERGTNAYNLALGERRAESVKAFLVDLGIDAARMTTISYGEEKPVAMGQDEESWAKNRRVEFVLE